MPCTAPCSQVLPQVLSPAIHSKCFNISPESLLTFFHTMELHSLKVSARKKIKCWVAFPRPCLPALSHHHVWEGGLGRLSDGRRCRGLDAVVSFALCGFFWLGAAGCSGQDVHYKAAGAGGCGFLGLEISPLVQKGSIFPVWLDSNFALVNYSLAQFRNRPVLGTAQGGVKCTFSIFALTFAVGKMSVFTFKIFNIFSIFFFS